jgi:nucleoside phosphorylase
MTCSTQCKVHKSKIAQKKKLIFNSLIDKVSRAKTACVRITNHPVTHPGL